MNKFMRIALDEAEAALSFGEVPVGAVVVCGGEVISKSHNQKERMKDPTAHAEILAIRAAASKLGDWRLAECDLYVTLEPCPMCAWAITQARVKRLYFGAHDTQYGAAGGFYDLVLGKCEVYAGICELECQNILNTFFKTQRHL